MVWSLAVDTPMSRPYRTFKLKVSTKYSNILQDRLSNAFFELLLRAYLISDEPEEIR